MRPIDIQPDRDLLPNPVERDAFGDGGVSVLSLRRGEPRDRNAGSTRSPSAEQALRLFGSVGLQVGLQQRELDQVVLRAAPPMRSFAAATGSPGYCRGDDPGRLRRGDRAPAAQSEG